MAWGLKNHLIIWRIAENKKTSTEFIRCKLISSRPIGLQIEINEELKIEKRNTWKKAEKKAEWEQSTFETLTDLTLKPL